MEPWEEILDDMLATLPPGFVWPRDRDSLMAALMEPLARGLADVYEATGFLARELNPRTAVWLLADYEEVLGPDPCLPGGFPSTLEERQIAAHARWTEAAGQTLAFFLERLRAFDPGVSIQEFAPFAIGVAAVGYDYPSPETWYAPDGLALATEDGAILTTEDGVALWTGPIVRMPPRWSLGPPEIAHYWRICFTPPEITWFRVGESAVGEPLCAFQRNEAAECFVRRFKPAHTEVIFDYSAPAWREPDPRRGM